MSDYESDYDITKEDFEFLLNRFKTQDLLTKWIEDCLLYWNRVLVGDFVHWCSDMDQIPIDETCEEEFDAMCSHGNRKPRMGH